MIRNNVELFFFFLSKMKKYFVIDNLRISKKKYMIFICLLNIFSLNFPIQRIALYYIFRRQQYVSFHKKNYYFETSLI